MEITDYHAKYFAHELTKRCSSDSAEKLAGTVANAQVDINPHQVEAALFAFNSPLSKGALLADEVGLGKTIEAGLVLSQKWAERKRRILVITPSNLRKQWHQELTEKFFLPCRILEAKSYNAEIKHGQFRPFESSEIIICSYQFAKSKAADVHALPWDLVVIDEAHRLRNVYKPSNVIANTLKMALAGKHKLLLTATPLQNSLLELFGLVSFIDEHTFGDLKSFREQFTNLNQEQVFQTLKARLKPVCHRTLRRQVTAYIPYTKRLPLVEEFTPEESEDRLYQLVSEYLQRENLQALPAGQRSLMTLVLRKLLASSTFAIAGALTSISNRLKLKLRKQASPESLEDELDHDYEALDETAEEWSDDEPVEMLTDDDKKAIELEVADLDSFAALATSINHNAKGKALLKALAVAFAKAKELGAAEKAIIFTESRRTQSYLLRLLADSPFAEGIVLFNGSNNDDGSKLIYSQWLEHHKGTDRVSGSRTADMRSALVDYFREEGRIMIATEAGAEGINLQFCSLVVNYDLPWNPQRIEQRIGRCHRYGQKHDVVVVNFLNRKNAADRRVFELLAEKFQLFEGVFGASDEVLGAIESGVDFEKRIVAIYQRCRKQDEIQTAFDQLQLELSLEINESMTRTRQQLLDNFDDEVREKLKVQDEASKAYLIRSEFSSVTDFEREFPSLCFALATGVGKSPRIKRLSEYIGESYFDYLAGLPDLVMLMDESHRYRASAGIRAINELKPILGLELTATPFVEGTKGAVAFKNVIVDYPLGKAMEDGFVKEPAVVTRKNFNPAGMSPEEIERMKLEDGVRLHESVKVELETYARETSNAIVKPFLLVIARDTTHAGQLSALIKSDEFFEGRYKDKVIQVDSSKSGAEEEEMIERLLKVEHTEEPTEIVIHVNMLKEGWDVTNLYTIVPLRAANARTLIEQSIGRGLRLPYGKRTGVTAVDRLNIVAHDKFQEIIDEANKPGSAIHLKAVVLDNDDFGQKTATIVSQPQIATQLGIKPTNTTGSTMVAGQEVQPVFTKPEEQKVAQIAYDVIRQLENQPTFVPTLAHLSKPEVQAAIVKAVQEQHRPIQMEIEGVTEQPDFAAVVAKTVELLTQQTIEIPRILVVPKGEVKAGFKPFTLKLDTLKYPAVSDELWIQHLRTGQKDEVTLGVGGIEEKRIEDYVVSGLMDFDDVSYDDQADFLYDLAKQTVKHFCSYLSEDEARKVLRCYQRDIAKFIHVQMLDHFWEEEEEEVDYDVKVNKGYVELKPSAYTYSVNEPTADYRVSPNDKSNMSKYVFGGFKRCLYPVQKFASEAERVLAVILERDAQKWFKPAKGQFLIFYRLGADHPEYQPDFVAETKDTIYMLEPKASNQMEDTAVLAKKDAAIKWCKNASDYAAANGGKPWRYVLIPHTAIAENMTIDGLANQFSA